MLCFGVQMVPGAAIASGQAAVRTETFFLFRLEKMSQNIRIRNEMKKPAPFFVCARAGAAGLINNK